MKEKTKGIAVVLVVWWRRRANGLFKMAEYLRGQRAALISSLKAAGSSPAVTANWIWRRLYY